MDAIQDFLMANQMFPYFWQWAERLLQKKKRKKIFNVDTLYIFPQQHITKMYLAIFCLKDFALAKEQAKGLIIKILPKYFIK